jgi:nitric oxide reductase subunit B
MSFTGAGFLGFAHTLPQVNLWTHGTLVTAMHGHMAFWGAYGMLIFAMICYALPNLTGRKRMNSALSNFAFWTTSIGMVAMTIAFGVAGVAQVYLERKMGMDFMQVQQEVEVHFLGLIFAAALFSIGFIAYVFEFIKSGLPLEDHTQGDKAYD